jgi:hypothetical protein
LEEVRRALWREIPPVLRDLLDLAVYVYAADSAVPRAKGGRVDGDEIGSGWRRRFRFRLPVRLPDLWNSAPVREVLTSTLGFVSEDEYAFDFVPLRHDTALDGYIDFNVTPFDGEVEEVVMFSGGLDSLAGAVTEAVLSRRKVLLVHHRSTEKLTRRHAELLRGLTRHADLAAPLHFPVRANKAKQLGKEFTQRTRSFLFAALGATFARMFGLDRFRFYENGVVSLNLPPSAQVVGARASRTTHPRVLAGFARLLTALVGKRFVVENPFLWDTKGDVVRRIAAAGCADLIGLSTSCGRTWSSTREQPHCGVCSQCIDRRFAVLSAGQVSHDPPPGYAVDLLRGEFESGQPRTMLTAYLDLVDRVERMGEAEFFCHFGEAARALPYLDLPPRVAASRVYELYRKHARDVTGVLNRAIVNNVDAVRRRELPRGGLLRLVYEDAGEHDRPAEEPRPDGNYFIQREAFWAVRFGKGQERLYAHEQGFEYLKILFESGGVTHTATKLAAAVRQKGKKDGLRAVTAADATGAGVGLAGGRSGAVALDDAAELQLHSRLEQIAESRELIVASDSATRIDELDELDKEERDIRDRLRKDFDCKGKPRKLGDMRNRVRNSVCNAIRRVLKRIEQYDKPLAEHLRPPVLNLGHTISYVPRADVRWKVCG